MNFIVYSPLESLLSLDANISFFSWPIIGFTTSLLFTGFFLPMLYGIEFPDLPFITEVSEPQDIIDGEFEDLELESEDPITDLTVDEEDEIWFLNYIVVPVTYISGVSLIGLLPYGLSHLAIVSITFTLTWAIYIQINVLGFALNRFSVVLLFLAKGAPIAVRLVLWYIEFISYIIRIFTLGIRLFANTIAGHSLLHIVLSGAWYFLIQNSLLVASFQTFWLIIIFMLELGVNSVQSMVLTILIALYIQEHIFEYSGV